MSKDTAILVTAAVGATATALVHALTGMHLTVLQNVANDIVLLVWGGFLYKAATRQR